MKRISLIIVCCLVLLLHPGSVYAAVKVEGASVDSDAYMVEFVGEKVGTASLKTPSGSTKYLLPKGYVSNITVRISNPILGGYLTITYGDGYTQKITGETTLNQYGEFTIPDTGLGTDSMFYKHPSQAINVKYTRADGGAKIVRVLRYNYYPTKPGSSGDDPSTDPGTGTDPDPGTGGGDDTGTDPDTGTNPDTGSGGDSGSGGDTGSGDTGSGGDTDSGQEQTDCDICKCIEEITPVMTGIGDQLHDDLDGVSNQLSGISGTLNNIDDTASGIKGDTAAIKGLTAQILNQMTPTRSYSVPAAVTAPAYYQPDSPKGVFTDNRQYFVDPGDAPDPGQMPAAPDPQPWKFNGTTLTQQKQTAESELNKDTQMSADQPASADDELSADSELNKDTQMTKQPVMQPSQPLQSTAEPTKDNELTPDQRLKADDPMVVDSIEPTVRWKNPR